MTKTSKIFLAISIAASALSFAEAGTNVGWGILRPVGAVTFITFFITNLLAKEMAVYDQEERAKLGQAEHLSEDSPKVTPSLMGFRLSATLETAAVN